MTNTIQQNYHDIAIGQTLTGSTFKVSHETIRDFAEASLDFNPLHFDEKYMEGDFGKTHFDGVIAHGMSTFALITRMITDWVYPLGGLHRRLETRWIAPVQPGDTITPQALVKEKLKTKKGNWVVLQIEVMNQKREPVAKGEAMVEFLE